MLRMAIVCAKVNDPPLPPVRVEGWRGSANLSHWLFLIKCSWQLIGMLH